jgi:hypothetical protein
MTARQRMGRELVPLLIIAALSVGVLWRTTLGGKVMLPGDLLLIMEPWKHYAYRFPEFHRVGNPILDAVQQFYPWRQFAGEMLRRGEVPLWNPYVLCGNPFVGNNQSAVFYPETWLHAIMPTERALGWATALSLFIAGSLMYWFLRVLELRRAAALLGAIAFMFNGFIVGWLCFPSFRSVPIWLPGMLAGLELSVRRRSAAWLSASALCTAMQFLAGNLHVSLFVLMAFLGYAGFTCLRAWRSGEARAAAIAAASAIGSLAMGTALAAVQLLPVLELAGMSARAGGQPYEVHLMHAMTLWHLLGGLMPDILGNPADANHWGATLGPLYRAYTETSWYVGLAPVLLAPAALGGRLRAHGWFWVGVGLVGLALALGSHLNVIIYYLVPGAKALVGVSRGVLLSSVSLAVLGAIGLDELLGRAHADGGAKVRRYAGLAGAAVGLVGIVGGMWVWWQTAPLEDQLPRIGDYTLAQVGRFALLCVLTVPLVILLTLRKRLAASALLVVLAADLYWFTDKFTPATRLEYLHVNARSVQTMLADREPFRILALGRDGIHRMAPNTPMIFGLEDIQGSDSLQVGAYRRLLDATQSSALGFVQPDPSLPVVSLLGVKYILSSVELPPMPGLTLLSHDDSWLYANSRALPRAFTVPSVRVVSDYQQALAAVTARDFDPAREAFIVADQCPTGTGDLRRPVTAAQISARGPNMVTVEGDFVPGQLLVLADTFYPGWRAFQDGRESPILRVDYALRAVEIKRPCRQVRFVYLPSAYRAGLFVSLVGAAVLVGMGTGLLARRAVRGGANG